jgi:hypothetical protein
MKLPGWHHSKGPGPDFMTTDGRLVLEVKRRAQGGLRDLRASLMQLAAWLAQQPNVSQGILAIHIPRITVRRVQQVWSETQAALKLDVARRMAIIALVQDTRWISPSSPELEAIADAVFSQPTLQDANRPVVGPTTGRPSASLFDVM